MVRIPLLYFDDFLTSFCHCIDACAETFWHTIRVHGELAPRANRKEQLMKKMIQTFVAGLVSTGYLIAHGETKTVDSQPATTMCAAGWNGNRCRKNTTISENGFVTNQPIRLNHIPAKEAASVIEGFQGLNGRFVVIERLNTVYVTDTQVNFNRMLAVIKEMDVPSTVREEVFEYELKYARASDIKPHLEMIGDGPLKELYKEKSKYLVHGKVQIVADDRSNKLIILTAKEINDFFKKVIETLDVETKSEMSVKMIRLKYADAEDVAHVLTNFMGTRMARVHACTNPKLLSNTPRSCPFTTNLLQVAVNRHCNSIIVSAPKSDMVNIRQVIEDMDLKLNQVLLKAVIVKVELDDDLQSGTDWIERGRQKFFDGDKLNLSAIIQATKTDDHAKCVAAQSVLTVDNKTATIEMSGMLSCDDFVMKMTPRINLYDSVTLMTEMTFNVQRTDQNAQNISILRPGRMHVTCKKASEIMLKNNQTFMLEGSKTARSELLVFITPHVLDGTSTMSPAMPNSR